LNNRFVAPLLFGTLLVSQAPAWAETPGDGYQGACSPGWRPTAGVPWLKAELARTPVDLAGWASREGYPDGKGGSGIRVFHRYAEPSVKQGKVAELKLVLDGIDSAPALAYVYALDGAQLAEAGKAAIYVGLEAGTRNASRVRIKAPRQGGGVAVVTCQRGRSTIFSVTLPGREFTRQPRPGSLAIDSQGEPIIRMQAD